jgi:hypothetical protein
VRESAAPKPKMGIQKAREQNACSEAIAFFNDASHINQSGISTFKKGKTSAL